MSKDQKKNHLSPIKIIFILLLFAMGLTMNALFCSHSNLYELFHKTAVIETWTTSEDTAAGESGDVNASRTHFGTGTATKSPCPVLMISAIPEGSRLLLSLIVISVSFFLALFTLLPDGWTLVEQKVRLDN